MLGRRQVLALLRHSNIADGSPLSGEERSCSGHQRDGRVWPMVLIKSPMRGLRLCIGALGTRLRSHFLNAPVGGGLHWRCRPMP